MGTVYQVGGRNCSLAHKSIDSNCQQDTCKRSDLRATETPLLIEKKADNTLKL